MAITLKATATLNTKPFMAGLAQISSGESALATTKVAGTQKAISATQKETAAKEAAARARISAVRAETAAQGQAQAQMANNLRQGVSAQRYLYGDMARMTARAALGFAVLPVAAAAAGIAWERDFADVVRTADPQFSRSTKSVERLRKSMVDMVQTMPTSWGEVTEIATLANQMGIASAETNNFTKAAAMFSATSGVSAEITATAFGRLRTIVPEIGSDFMGLADSILKVGVNSVATEGEIINIVTQISSIAGAAGMTDKEMIGLAGAMASVRIPPELSRGVVTRVFGQISRAVSDGGASLEGFAKIAGMTGDEFAESWGTKGKTGKAFVSFMDGLKKLGPQAEAELRGLGITSVRDVPVMLRLANAADSEGVIGGLLKQTIGDAEDAAGETQRQYQKMADTVGAKLKVVGNNLLAFFDAISRSSLGPMGTVLDKISSGLAKLTNDIDKPFKLFGSLKMPFTNGELIGTIGVLSLVASSILAIGSAVLKVKEIVAGMTLLGAAMGRGKGDPTGIGRIASQWTAFPGQVKSVMSTATNAMARGYGRMAVLNERYAKSLDPSNKTQIVRSTGHGAQREYVSSMAVQARATEQFAQRANRATTAVQSGFSAMGRGVAAVGRGIGAAAAAAFGPWGLAAALALGGIAYGLEKTSGATTDIDELANYIAKVGGNSEKAAQKIREIEIGGLFGSSTQLFKEGFKDLNQLNKELEATYGYQKILDGSKGEYFQAFAGQAASASKAANEFNNQANYGKSVEIMDKAFGNLEKSGNIAHGVAAIRKFTGSSKELFKLLQSEEATNMRNAFEAAFDYAGIEMTEQSLEKLAKGSLPEVQNALLGLSGAAALSAAELAEFEGGEAAFAALAEATEKAAASFINYSKAINGEDGTPRSLSDFTAELNTQIAAQQKWGENLAKVARIGGKEAVEAFVGMGAEAAPILQQLVDDFEASGGDAGSAWKSALDTIIRSTETTEGQVAIQVAAAVDRMRAQLKDSNLVDALAASLSDDQFTTLSRSFEGLGKDAATSLSNGFLSGAATFEETISRATQAQRPKIRAEIELSTEATGRFNKMLTGFAKANNVEVPVGMKLDATTTIAEFRQIMGDDTLFPKVIEADLDMSVADAYSKYESVRTYMIANGLDVDLAANPAMAYVALDTFEMIANGSISTATIDALTAPADGHLWQFITLADGTIVTVQVDSDTGQALGQVYEVNDAAEAPADKFVSATTAQATEAIAAVDAAAKAKQTKPVDVNVSDNGTAAAVSSRIDAAAADRYSTIHVTEVVSKKKADGGVDTYANGGVRENHVAQIAPAGAMRLWAEPETGGEAYIPLAKSKRARSEAILADVAQRFGMSLQPQNYTKYADGGQYNAQVMSRIYRSAAPRTTEQRSLVDDKRSIEFTFVNPVVRDPFEDALEKTRELGVKY